MYFTLLQFTIRVGDKGNLERFADLEVSIFVDRDKADPLFDRNDYFVTIPETTAEDFVIETVRATDGDVRPAPVKIVLYWF